MTTRPPPIPKEERDIARLVEQAASSPHGVNRWADCYRRDVTLLLARTQDQRVQLTELRQDLAAMTLAVDAVYDDVGVLLAALDECPDCRRAIETNNVAEQDHSAGCALYRIYRRSRAALTGGTL